MSTLSVGVTLFFTLSGFLLYRPFAAAIARGDQHGSIRSYLYNRVLRIAPAYWFILAFAALVIGAASVRDSALEIQTGYLTNPASLLQAAFLLQDYHPRTVVIGIGPAGSLAVEAVFYCVLPLLVIAAAAAARRAKDRTGRALVLLGPALLLLLIGLSGKYVTHLSAGNPSSGYYATWHSVIERSFWAQADLFTFGMIVAVLHTEVVDGRIVLPRHWRSIAVALGLLVFVPCAWTMHQGEQSYLLQNTGEALGIALLFAAVMIPDRHVEAPIRAVRLLETPALVAVGLASYSLFLWYVPVIDWLTAHGLTLGGWGGLLVNLVVVAIIAGGLSALTYRFVELPALRRKRSTREPATARAPVVTGGLETAAAPAAAGDPAN